ncbi:hypothetical protein GCM10022407_13250 [Hymenobacter antarcticus]|uniref:Uncharacterized protein n=1 Tax=Hymenobacter antarcticus TaxID=486270 RepID=A0ABP7PN66_9BACT
MGKNKLLFNKGPAFFAWKGLLVLGGVGWVGHWLRAVCVEDFGLDGGFRWLGMVAHQLNKLADAPQLGPDALAGGGAGLRTWSRFVPAWTAR